MIPLGQGPRGQPTGIPLRYANRHGLITGPTGTGKTVTLQKLAEEFSRAGVPVFVADVKGDISALSQSCPVQFLDVFGQSGKPLRVSIKGLGPDMLARSLCLSDAQSGCLDIASAVAASARAPFATLDDLRAILSRILNNRREIGGRFGLVSPASVGAIQRALLRLEREGGTEFFGSPAFDVADLLHPSVVSILTAERLISSPAIYSTFLLWLLTSLYERLPEVGDSERPKLVFIFDEAHLLFDDCPAHLLRRIEQIVRLVRSKGVGIYFASQSPQDVPHIIREQLAHRIHHGRALGVGRALLTSLDRTGKPTATTEIRVTLPSCPLGAIARPQRAVTEASPTLAPVSIIDRLSHVLGYGIGFLGLPAIGFLIAWLTLGG